jgi:hypothetical protein
MLMRLTLAVAAGDEHIRGGDSARGRARPTEVKASRQLGKMHAQHRPVAPPLTRRGPVARDAVAQAINHHRLPFFSYRRKELKMALITSTFGRHFPKILCIQPVYARCACCVAAKRLGLYACAYPFFTQITRRTAIYLGAQYHG